MIPTKDMTSYVPISVNEIVEVVHKALEIGITMVHLHARNERTGEPTHKAEIYRNIIEGIRKFSKDLVILYDAFIGWQRPTKEGLCLLRNSGSC